MATILILEDDNMLLSSVMEILELNGYTTYGAGTGTQGLEMAAHYQPHLIITDVHMPSMDGVRFIKTLRQQPATQSTPVIIMTASDDMLALGDIHHYADSFLRKPFDPTVLLSQIESLLSVSVA